MDFSDIDLNSSWFWGGGKLTSLGGRGKLTSLGGRGKLTSLGGTREVDQFTFGRGGGGGGEASPVPPPPPPTSDETLHFMIRDSIFPKTLLFLSDNLDCIFNSCTVCRVSTFMAVVVMLGGHY